MVGSSLLRGTEGEWFKLGENYDTTTELAEKILTPRQTLSFLKHFHFQSLTINDKKKKTVKDGNLHYPNISLNWSF